MNKVRQYSDTITKVRAILNIEQPVIVIELANNSQNIVRTPKQFLLDLQDSHMIPANINDINNPLVQDAMIDLQGGRVNGAIEFFKAGTKYVADENSSVITNPDHALYGKVKVGQEVEREKDGSRVEGFLSFDRSFIAKQTRANANAVAAQMLGILGGTSATTAVVATNDEETEETEEPSESTSKKAKASA